MKIILRIALPLWLCVVSIVASAEARVFNLSNPDPESILHVLQTTYGDKVRIDLIQQRLVVVGSAKQLDEVGALLAKIDRPPTPLHLTLREQPPPAIEQGDVVVYSSGDDGYTVDTVEGALVALEYQQVVQQPTLGGLVGIAPQAGATQPANTAQSTNTAQATTSRTKSTTSTAQGSATQSSATQNYNGSWLVQIDNQLQQVSSLTLQVQLQNSRTAQILVSYSREENQQRRVFGNTLIGDIGAWIPLLPQPLSQMTDKNTISSGAKRGEQLYLRIERRTR